jgi:opacity protein-like surface antigen
VVACYTQCLSSVERQVPSPFRDRIQLDTNALRFYGGLSMTRFALLAIVCVAALCVGAGTAHAQATPSAHDGRYSAEFTAAATLGHKSSGSLGAEFDYRFNDDWDFFFEAGRMSNVASSANDARAQLIASTIGASASLVQRAAYFDAGARYRLMARGRWDPYLTLGFGGASVKTRTTFSANQDQVQLGTDLAGTLTKPLLMIGVGATMPFKQRYFADLSYRYGHIFARTGEIEDDRGINTQRVQIGVGLKF